MAAMTDAYAAAGVDTSQADRGVDALVGVLRTIELDRPSASVLGSGHYASVLRVAPGLGIAMSTDGVGSKIVVAEQADRLETVGIDCVAMNVNDVICVGAEPIAMLDYLAVEQADPAALARIAPGLKAGAEAADVEIPGGELAILPELIRGHPSPHGFDLCGTAIGTVALDAIVTGEAASPGDALIGLPSSGLHSNGYTLARRALLDDAGLALDATPPGLGGASVADALLEPTVIYVRAVLELLRSRGAGPRPGPHHRRRPAEPAAPRRGAAGLRGRGPAARPARHRPDRRGAPVCRTRSCGRSSTWGAASSRWCRPSAPMTPWPCSPPAIRAPRGSAP